MQIKNGEFWLGDCLELMKNIPDGSVDMILCDLPYGTTACKWDTIIPFDPLWEQYWRVAKPNAAIVLTASQPFTSALVMSAVDKFRHEWVWDKVNRYTGALQANKRRMRRHEDILIFSDKPIEIYNKQFRQGKQYSVTRSGGHGEFNNNADIDKIRKGENNGKHNPCSVLEIKADVKTEMGLHPTQKPVALFEYLIKTYTNEGETVLDNCAGSGTTAVAAEQCGRKWICIEQLPEYYYPAIIRVAGI